MTVVYFTEVSAEKGNQKLRERFFDFDATIDL